MGLIPSPKPKGQAPSGNHVEPSKPWPRAPDYVETQMKFSAAMSKCLDQGMSYDDAKDYIEACADDIKAGVQTPWRRKIGENRYQAECGCIFNSDRVRIICCRDHESRT
jgi:hypothetical protein